LLVPISVSRNREQKARSKECESHDLDGLLVTASVVGPISIINVDRRLV
jgi:hypothetical protein